MLRLELHEADNQRDPEATIEEALCMTYRFGVEVHVHFSGAWGGQDIVVKPGASRAALLQQFDAAVELRRDQFDRGGTTYQPPYRAGARSAQLRLKLGLPKAGGL